MDEKKIVLPAYAGMILRRVDGVAARAGAPRIRGDDPIPRNTIYFYTQCSPHTRG